MGDEAKPSDGGTEISNRVVRRILVAAPTIIAVICFAMWAIEAIEGRSDPQLVESRRSTLQVALVLGSVASAVLLMCLLWSIRDKLVEIRDRLPAPRPVPSAKK